MKSVFQQRIHKLSCTGIRIGAFHGCPRNLADPVDHLMADDEYEQRHQNPDSKRNQVRTFLLNEFVKSGDCIHRILHGRLYLTSCGCLCQKHVLSLLQCNKCCKIPPLSFGCAMGK